MGRRAPLFLILTGLLAPAAPHAQQPPPEKPESQAEQRSSGLPSRLHWTFNFDATWGTFGFGNSLVTNPKEGVQERLSDQWFEGSIKPSLSARYVQRTGSEVYGKLSAVGERTYGEAPVVAGSDFSSFQVEDLAIGWRSGTAFERLGENALDVTVGRVPYTLGRGLLLWDGAAEGGSRGGYWTNARKAFQFGAVARFKPGRHTAEAFYLDRDDLPERETGTRLWGLNYEFRPADHTTLGATYMRWYARREELPERDGLNVLNLRAYTAPVPSAPDLSFDVEYAAERHGDILHASAWTLLGAYEFATTPWKPRLSYRYAFFEGDRPDTSRSEAFDPLLPGFSDWGSWWQGEIAGEYFLLNSNLISHQVRAHVSPTDALSGGLILYDFTLDQPGAYGATVTHRDLAREIDAYTDWGINDNFTLSVVLAFANPGRAVQQAIDRTKNFRYGMVFVAYSY